MNEDADLQSLDDFQFLEQAYRRTLGRAVDPLGLRDYLKRLRAGARKEQVLSELRSSVEGQAYAARAGIGAARGNGPSHPERSREIEGLAADDLPIPSGARPKSLDGLLQATPADFVAQCYRLILGREADPAGYRNYVVGLGSGLSRHEVMRQLLVSDEGVAFNAPLPEIRAAVQRRRFVSLPGIRHAIRVLRRAVSARPARGARGPAASDAQTPARSTPTPVARAYPHNLKTSMMEPTSDPRELDEPTSRLNMLAESPVQEGEEGSEALVHIGADEPELGWSITIERFTGSYLRGWSCADGEPRSLSLDFGGRTLGKLAPNESRGDVKDALRLYSDNVGIDAVLGGLLQFFAMAPACSTLSLTQVGTGGGHRNIPLEQYLPEALTFAPMRALMRPLPSGPLGTIRALRMTSGMDAALIFETEAKPGAIDQLFMDLYQERTEGALVRIARFSINLTGQIVDLEFRMLDSERPILMILTDTERNILATDCFPLPALSSEANAPLLEYHVVLETGKQPFGVVAKIARSFLDTAIRARLGLVETSPPGPTRRQTCLLLYVQGNTDRDVAQQLRELRGIADEAAWLQRDGSVINTAGQQTSLADFLAGSKATYFLFHNADAQLRPDFWAVLEEHRFRVAESPSIVHCDAIWIDGVARPYVVKAGMLLHPAFTGHALLHARTALVRRDVVLQAFKSVADQFRSGRFSVEEAFPFVEPAQVVRLPIVLTTVRAPIVPLANHRFAAENIVPPIHPGRANKEAARPCVSIVINYRDSAEDTIRCLESIRMQDYSGPLDIILVNNGSTADSVNAVVGRAHALFGEASVQPIDYPKRFNHSDQCNVAALAARGELLLMLSNDSALRTPAAITRAAQLAMVPWVGTVGFRIVGNAASKGRIQSVGLSLTERRYMFSGGSPITTGQVPAFAHECTFEVVGNTFAAVMLRRDVYVQLDGLDTQAFPTSYNDIDFSFRATRAGYRHIVMASEVVEHMGRGSREADQDLPIDQRILDRAPTLAALTRVGFQQL
ncbi:MAG: DUF4214 domain-containing protein [Burkholderiaceae bacterium]